MDGKHGRHKRAAPERAGHPSQHEKQQDDGRRMEQDIGKVVAGGIQSIKLAVQHMGNPGQGMPVGASNVGEGPAEAFPSQPFLDDRILIDIMLVVIVDKRVVQRLTEHEPDDRRQKDNDRRNHEPVVQASGVAGARSAWRGSNKTTNE